MQNVKIIPLIAVVLVVVTQSGCLTHRVAKYAIRRGRDAARAHAAARREARTAAEARDAQGLRDPRDPQDRRDDRRTDPQSATKPSGNYDQPDRR